MQDGGWTWTCQATGPHHPSGDGEARTAKVGSEYARLGVIIASMVSVLFAWWQSLAVAFRRQIVPAIVLIQVHAEREALRLPWNLFVPVAGFLPDAGTVALPRTHDGGILFFLAGILVR